MLPGNVDFIGRMYAFGAMLSFTIAHASVIQMRRKPPPVEEPYRVRPSVRIRGVDWPLFAVLGGHRHRRGLARRHRAGRADPVRRARLARGRVRRLRDLPPRHRASRCARRRARRSCSGPAIALEYRKILVPVVAGAEGQEAIDLAARLAAERGATIVALRVIVVPMDLPLDADCPSRRSEADRLLDERADRPSSTACG